jgi:hypothetical protein
LPSLAKKTGGEIMKFYFADGIVRYKGDWIIIEAPYDIVLYYKWWVEKHLGKKISTSYHKPHITVLAGKHEQGLNKHKFWAKYDGAKVPFKYYTYLHTDNRWFTQGKYFWLRVECPLVPVLRRELGLKPELKWPTHLTIGYCGY